MITVRSTINIAHQSVPNVIPVVQGDTGRSILFTLADFTIPAGATARYFITKPSGLAVYNDATIDGNTVLVDLTAQSLAEYGDCPGQVRISVGDAVVTSFEFILHVEPFRGIDAVESSTETNIFDKAVEDAREAIAEAAEEAEEYISQALDTTLTIPDKAADAKATGDAISDSADAVIAQMRAEIADVYPTETAQGNPATFDDGAESIPVKDLKVSIVPNQDLHGYDKPWAGGAGKNLFKYPYTSTSGTSSGITVTLNNDGSVRFNGTATGDFYFNFRSSEDRLVLPAGTYTVSINTMPASCTLYMAGTYLDSMNMSRQFMVNEGVGISAYILIPPTAGAIDFTLKVQIESGSTATSWVPYENICPISGMTEVEVGRTGKNLLPMTVAGIKAVNIHGTWNGNAFTRDGVTFTVLTDNDGNVIGINANGTASANSQFYLNVINYEANVYKGCLVNGCTGGSNNTYNILLSYSNDGSAWAAESYVNTGDVTVSSTYDFIRISILVRQGVSVSNKEFYPMVRLSTDSATFEPYHTHQTVTTDLGRTVYGGTLDVTTGTLTVTQVMATVTESMMQRNRGTSWWVSLGSAGYPNAKVTGSIYTDGVLSDKFATGTGLHYCIFVNDTGAPRINTSKEYASVADMYADIGEFSIVYPLATPQTYALTPQELLSVLGTNHISTDAESVDVVYRADIALYIENLTKPGDDDMIANNAITSGKFFMVNNRLFLSTTSIAKGATINPGTNCTELSLSDALNSLA